MVWVQCHCFAPQSGDRRHQSHVHGAQLCAVLRPRFTFCKREEQPEHQHDKHGRQHEPARHATFTHRSARGKKCISRVKPIKASTSTFRHNGSGHNKRTCVQLRYDCFASTNVINRITKKCSAPRMSYRGRKKVLFPLIPF